MVGRSSRTQSVLKGIILMFDESGSSEIQNWLRIKNRGNIIPTECLENLAPLYETEVAKLETLIEGTTTAYKNNEWMQRKINFKSSNSKWLNELKNL